MTREEFMKNFNAINKEIEEQRKEIEAKEIEAESKEIQDAVGSFDTMSIELNNQFIFDEQNRLFNEQVQRDLIQNNMFMQGMI